MEEIRKQKVVMGKIAKSRIIIFSMLCVLLLATSCEQRDPQAEFELLRETVYSSPQEGEETAQEYIDYFCKKKGARITEASEIRDQYRKMVHFFSISFNSYPDFLSKSRELNYELSYSNYDGVRRMWLARYEAVNKRLLAPLMDSITASDFDSFFQEQVKQLCANEFDNWTVESIDQASLSAPILVDGGMAKKSSGEYRIHLRGNHLGLSSTARISVEGTIGPDDNGNVVPNRTFFSFLSKPIIK